MLVTRSRQRPWCRRRSGRERARRRAKISKTVLNRVMNGGRRSCPRTWPRNFPESQSVSESEIRSLMCVPLLDQDRKPVGIVQIDTRDGRARFDQDDLDLLVAVGSQISVAVQNAGSTRRGPARDGAGAPVRPPGDAGAAARAAGIGAGLRVLGVLRAGPARRGRYYGFFPIGPRPPAPGGAPCWAVAVGDVVGKGMPGGALLTARLSAEVRLFLQGNPDRPGSSASSTTSSTTAGCSTCISRSSWSCWTSRSIGSGSSTPAIHAR